MNPQAAKQVPVLESVAERYDVLAPLGKGGMAAAYRVRDRSTGRQVALKRLAVTSDATAVVELFEKEFHTLSQLAHPRIVRAFDYGWDGEHPYYTMELLDGGDVRELAPLPWRDACAIAYDICSALSLLHSRRLVHRDLTPRNVRRTSDGAAKLIDFGLLSEFGPNNMVAGTPPYVAPEVINTISLDARSDLFSLGATLYFALTGRVAFRAASFEQLRDVWRATPRSPRSLVPEIPEALDQLVLALIRLDAGSRPKSAAEVMERLLPLLSKRPDKALDAAGAYLTAPVQVGRDELVVRMRKQMFRARLGRGGGFLISGAPGAGRSRMLDLFVIEAKLMGAVTARGDAGDAASGALGVARSIVEQVHAGARAATLEAARADPRIWRVLFGSPDPDATKRPMGLEPPLLDIRRPELEPAEVQSALRDWLLFISQQRLLALAIDDLDMVDGPSAALIASQALDAARQRIAYCVSANSETTGESASTADAVLRRHARPVQLAPLTQPQMRQLLAGVFGEAPNLDGLSRQLHQLSSGRPRDCMMLAQHLVDQRVIVRAGGVFKLPEAIDPSSLPKGLEDALAVTVEALCPTARTVGQLLSLGALGKLSRAQLAAMEGLSSALVDQAIDQHRSAKAITGTPEGYRLCQPAIAGMLMHGLDAQDLARLHDQLADAYRASEEGAVAIALHALQGQDAAAALDKLLEHCHDADSRIALGEKGQAQLGVHRTAETFELALSTAQTLGRGKRVHLMLWPSLAGNAAGGADARYYDMVAPAWLGELKRLSGYQDWQVLSHVSEPGDRAIQAFAKASERHEATPEAERLLAPTPAIKELVAYVVFSIAVGARTARSVLLETLPGLLEPFAPISPVVNAMRLNAEATCCHARWQLQEARTRWIALIDVIDAIEGEALAFMDRVRAAICQAIATLGARLGIDADPDEWITAEDPSQRVGAEYIKKIAALHRGDWEAAETHRRRAELIALQHDTAPMFTTLEEELEAHLLARDLTGLRSVRERIRAWAAGSPEAKPAAMRADACYHHLCGEGDAALAKIEEVRRLREEKRCDAPDTRLLEMVAVEILLARDQVDTALALGRQLLDDCRAGGQHHLARLVACVVALAEARAGACEEAKDRIAGVITEQNALNVKGLLLGRSAEYLARCAIAAQDREGFSNAAAAAAQQYRPGHSAILGALHERLIEDARRAGLIDETLSTRNQKHPQTARIEAYLHTTLMSHHDPQKRAQAALELLCEGADCKAGHLYLLTGDGLSACAAMPGQLKTSAEMLTFVRAQLELELDTDVCTMTSANLTASLSASATSALTGGVTSTAIAGMTWEPIGTPANTTCPQVLDPEGRAFKPQVLLSEREGQTLAVGVFLLPANATIDDLDAITAAVAQHLIDSGDCRPLIAA